jgi:hypothetical protein
VTKETPKTIVWNRKREREHAEMMLLAAKELKRMAKGPPLSPADRKERRRLQQAERRAAKAISEVIL